MFLGIKRLKSKQFDPTQKSNDCKIGEDIGVVIYLHQGLSILDAWAGSPFDFFAETFVNNFDNRG